MRSPFQIKVWERRECQAGSFQRCLQTTLAAILGRACKPPFLDLSQIAQLTHAQLLAVLPSCSRTLAFLRREPASACNSKASFLQARQDPSSPGDRALEGLSSAQCPAFSGLLNQSAGVDWKWILLWLQTYDYKCHNKPDQWSILPSLQHWLELMLYRESIEPDTSVTTQSFYQLARYESKSHWAVVRRIAFGAFFEHRCYVGNLPVFWHGGCL
ncbi:uncharacterized protein LOC112549810 [Alligator sinensis]|uniref:Uncharacterized protein LOC112549810 n=1 Tax=Alligator sinensis TaxID=38654 RepID=A0A3Q0GD20_ALLSI|nr:uncharacterized protein LOC112549810 [Alligator sinensis]